jgi:hypothetical protein
MQLTLQQVKEYFIEHGCQLLEDEYINARTKMKYICSCGNESLIVLYSFKNGNRCKLCGNKKSSQKNSSKLLLRFLSKEKIDQLSIDEIKKLSIFHLKEYFITKGCVLLENEYINSQTKMKFICSCGAEHFVTWNNFQKGKITCFKCSVKKRSGENHYEWILDREAKKEFDDFKQRCYKFLKIACNCAGVRKNSRTECVLGCKISDFKNHIKSHPNWENLKGKRWHVDHIFPIKAFVDHGVIDIKIINALDNLQPLLYSDNLAKSDKYDLVEFKIWLKKKENNDNFK